MTTNELRVFISSTFRDLQEEREHLVKKIFPEIRALCRQRGVTFTDVDLRWGLTEEEAMLGRVIRTCLEEVDRCRPYFIGMIGNRYGWVPEVHEVLMDPDLLAKYPWIEDVAIEGASVTEMEFIHGVFDAPQVDGEYAFFYHRAGSIDEADDPARLASLIERSRNSGNPFREFMSVDELGELVRADLVAMIDRDWPVNDAPTPLELQRRAHAAFAASRIRAYIPNPQHLKSFTTWLAEGTTPLVVRGESGLGKSSLVAYLTEYFRKKNPSAFVIEHYVGAAPTSGSGVSVMRHVIDEICARFDIHDEIPANEEELRQSFPNWLYRCEHVAKQSGVPVMIVIDAVNQLGESGRRLSWLPEIIPGGITLIISTAPGITEDQLLKRPWNHLMVTPLSDERVRQSIVVRYLGEFHKGITPEQVRRVTGNAKASSPLYLRVVAEEMRLHGEHETLEEKISRYANAADLAEVFDRVLERIEQDYGAAPVRDLLSLMWGSREGLEEVELMEVAGLSRLELSRLLFAFDYHLVLREGTLGFFHDYLRRAVEKRYLPDGVKQTTIHQQLAEYFQCAVTASIGVGANVSRRMASELAYQLHASGATERLQECLSTMDVFLALFEGETEYDVLTYWSAMADGTDIEGNYRRGMDRWVIEDARERSRGLGRVADLLERLGRWAGAIELQRERLASANARSDRHQEAESRRSIGVLLIFRAAYGEALTELSQALELFTDLGDRRGLAGAIGSMGVVYATRGEFDRALESFERQLSICTEFGDRSGIAAAIGNMGIVYKNRGEYDRALESYERSLSICTELGDRRGVAVAIANIGTAHANRGEYDRALESFERRLSISRELGDRGGATRAIGNMGQVHMYRGEYDRALENYQQSLSMSTELGDRGGVARALGSMGLVYARRGENDRALERFHLAASTHRGIGSRRDLANPLVGTAQVLLELDLAGGSMPEYLPKYVPDVTEERWRLMALREARICAEECIAISDQFSKPDTQLAGRVALARIDAAEGHPETARERLRALLREATNTAQGAELHYWLWKLGADTPAAAEHARAALALYEALYAKAPKFEYKTRIDELVE